MSSNGEEPKGNHDAAPLLGFFCQVRPGVRARVPGGEGRGERCWCSAAKARGGRSGSAGLRPPRGKQDGRRWAGDWGGQGGRPGLAWLLPEDTWAVKKRAHGVGRQPAPLQGGAGGRAAEVQQGAGSKTPAGAAATGAVLQEMQLFFGHITNAVTQYNETGQLPHSLFSGRWVGAPALRAVRHRARLPPPSWPVTAPQPHVLSPLGASPCSACSCCARPCRQGGEAGGEEGGRGGQERGEEGGQEEEQRPAQAHRWVQRYARAVQRRRALLVAL